MQKHRNKLALGRETIRTLQTSELGNIAGGVTQSGGQVTILAAAHNPTSKAQPISVLTE